MCKECCNMVQGECLIFNGDPLLDADGGCRARDYVTVMCGVTYREGEAIHCRRLTTLDAPKSSIGRPLCYVCAENAA